MAVQHLPLAFSGLSCPGRGPLGSLCSLLAPGLHHPCRQDERSSADHHPPYVSRGCPRVPAGKGLENVMTQSLTNMDNGFLFVQRFHSAKNDFGCVCVQSSLKCTYHTFVCMSSLADTMLRNQSHLVLRSSGQCVLLQIHSSRH